MRLGLHLGYWGLGLTAEQQIALVKEAESAGFDSCWAAEAYGSDAATVLAWVAAQTEKIRIGSSIFQMPARSPAMTAMTAATLDHLSDGRMILGIGHLGPAGGRGLARPALRQAAAAHPRVRGRSCARRWPANGSSSTATPTRCPSLTGRASRSS